MASIDKTQGKTNKRCRLRVLLVVSSRSPGRRVRDISLVMLTGRLPDPLGWEPRNYDTMEMTSGSLPFLPQLLPPWPRLGSRACLAVFVSIYNVATLPGSASAGGVGDNESG